MKAILTELAGLVKRILDNANPRALVIKFVRYNNLRRVSSCNQKLKDLVVSVTENTTLLRLKKLDKKLANQKFRF